MSPEFTLGFKRKLIAIAVFLALVAGAIGTEDNPGIIADSKHQNELQAQRRVSATQFGNNPGASPWSKDAATPNSQPAEFRPPSLVPLK